MCLNYNIKKCRTNTYNPQCNGKIERLHRTLKESIRCLSDDHNWLTNLPQTLLGLRNTPNTNTNKTPSQNIFKHTPNILNPKQINKNVQPNQSKTPKPILKQTINNNQTVYIKKPITKGFESKFNGPYEIKHIQNNIVTYIKNKTEHKVNIRRTKIIHDKNKTKNNVHFIL